MNGKCGLCGRDSELKESHIIPKFVFKWFKKSAPSAIRGIDIPNLRVQDGIKQRLLCSECEQLFCAWEKDFYEDLFLPLHNKSTITTPIRYGPWALKFAVSVSWRVLTYYYRSDDLSHFSDKQREAALIALDVWRLFLIGKLANPEQFEQHLILVDAIENYSGPQISPFLNRYLLRSVQMDVICSKVSALVYAKMGQLILFGFIQEKSAKRWKTTKIHVSKGMFPPRIFYLPRYIEKYFNEKANAAAKSLASMSPRQKQIVRESILENADELAESEIFRAMQYDVYHSGDDAFKITEEEKQDKD